MNSDISTCSERLGNVFTWPLCLMTCLLGTGLAIGSGSFGTQRGMYCVKDCVGGVPYGDEAGDENADKLWFNDWSDSLYIGIDLNGDHIVGVVKGVHVMLQL